MKKVSKIIIVCLLITITTSTMFFLNKKESASSNGMFAIMLETSKGTGKYENAKDNKWPQSDEYVINMYKTYCEKGSMLRWNNETKRINATVKGTDKCYVYFDLSEYGNEEHPYLIQTIEDLVRLSNEVNSGTTYAGKYFLLTNDLDFQDEADYEDASRIDFKDINGINGDEALITELTTGSGFVPIGNSEVNSFQGIFDGNNKKIENIHITNSSKENIGLFGISYASTIKNLSITGNIENNIISYVGGLVGKTNGKVNIINIKTNISITNNTMGSIIGGIIGVNNGELDVSNSINEGSIIGVQNTSIGGILGKDYSNSMITKISDSYNNGEITVAEELPDSEENIYNNIGGIIGLINGTVNIDNCYNNVTLKGVGTSYVGGIVGSLNGYTSTSSSISNSYNKGNIFGIAIGGIVSRVLAYKTLVINKCYNIGKLSSYASTKSVEVGGIVTHNSGSGSELIILNSSNAGELELKLSPGPWPSVAGIVAVTNWDGKSYVINSYNVGNIVTSVSGHGIGVVVDNSGNGSTTVYTNNVYHLGKINSPYASGTIPDLAESTVNYFIINTYNDSSNQNRKNKDAIDETSDFIKSQSFVDILNSNIVNKNTLKNTKTNETQTLEEINSTLKGYTLSEWTLGLGGYPTLINE